jgi:hypothetical protein
MARKQVIAALDRTVEGAVQFFRCVDEHLFDGEQSARDVISHLVFWHREYVRTISALVEGRPPRLMTGKFREYNALATQMFARQSLRALAWRLAQSQAELDCALRRLSDWRADFPMKQETKYCSVNKRLPQIRAHIAGHVMRLKQSARRKEAHG